MVADADHYFTSSTQRLDCLDRGFCHSTIYLRIVLNLCISKGRLTITEADRVALSRGATLLLRSIVKFKMKSGDKNKVDDIPSATRLKVLRIRYGKDYMAREVKYNCDIGWLIYSSDELELKNVVDM